MKTKDEMTRGMRLSCVLLLALAVSAMLLLSGCESDSVVPHENLPAVTQDDAAQQAALVAMAVSQVGPEIVRFDGVVAGAKALGVYTHEFPPGADVQGIITLEYFDGGPGGVHSSWEDTDYALLYTVGDEGVTVALGPGGGLGLTFNLTAAVDRPADTATVSGSGTFVSGENTALFSFSEVVVTAVSSYPSGGSMGFTAGSYDLVVSFDGDKTAVILVDDVATYIIDLEDGSVTQIPAS